MSKNKLFDTEKEDIFSDKGNLSVEMGKLAENLDTSDKKELLKFLGGKEFSVTLVKTGIGFICIVVGVVLIFLGINGAIDFNIEAKGFIAKLVNGSPGIFLVLIGFLIIILSNFTIKK